MRSQSQRPLRRLTLSIAVLGAGLVAAPTVHAQGVERATADAEVAAPLTIEALAIEAGSAEVQRTGGRTRGAAQRQRTQPQRTGNAQRASGQTRGAQARPEATRERAPGQNDRIQRSRPIVISERERALQARLENAGVLPRIRSAAAGDDAVRPLRQRLEEAGAMPRVRTAMSELRQPSRQPRSPRLADMGRLSRSQVMRELFTDQSKHRVRMAQLDRLEELGRRSGRTERVEQVRGLRERERSRHERFVDYGETRLGERGMFRSIVTELEARPIGS